MIRVNLLPQEYRKAEATPLKQFFATIGAAVVVTVAVVAWAYVHWGVLGNARQDLETIQNTVKTQEPDVKRSQALARWVADFRGQYEKIDQVAKNRLVWSRKLDELWDLVVSPKQPGRYEVWLRGLTCSLQPGTRSGGQTQFAGNSAGAQVAKLADFHEDLKSGDFFRDYGSITYPYGTREELGPKNREPAEGWTFNFTLLLKPLEKVYKDRAELAQAEAGKPEKK